MTERERVILNMRKGGLSFEEIAAQFNISPRRAKIYFSRALMDKSYQNLLPWDRPLCYGLSTKAKHCLDSLDIEWTKATKKEVYEKIKAYGPARIRNYGRKTHAEVLAWLGVAEWQLPFTRGL